MSRIVAMNIAILILASVVTLVSSKKKYSRHADSSYCPNDFKKSTKYTSWRRAKAACDKKKNCFGFYNSCKINNEFYLCDVESTTEIRESECGSTLFVTNRYSLEAGIYVYLLLYI